MATRGARICGFSVGHVVPDVPGPGPRLQASAVIELSREIRICCATVRSTPHGKYGIALRSASPTIIDGTEVPCYLCINSELYRCSEACGFTEPKKAAAVPRRTRYLLPDNSG